MELMSQSACCLQIFCPSDQSTNTQSGRRKYTAMPRTMVTIPSVRMSLRQSAISFASSARSDWIPPFPTRETSGSHTIKRKCKYTADDCTEVAEYRDQNDTLSQLVRSVPVTKLQEYTRPKSSFLQNDSISIMIAVFSCCLETYHKSKEGTNGIESAGVLDGRMAAQYDTPRYLTLSAVCIS
jgi:hypothetical protein